MKATREQRETVAKIAAAVGGEGEAFLSWGELPGAAAALRAVLQDADEADRLRRDADQYRRCMEDADRDALDWRRRYEELSTRQNVQRSVGSVTTAVPPQEKP